MLATAHVHHSTMRDLEQELRDTLAKRHSANGAPLEGLLNLSRCMDNDDDEQFDVDLTILDFLVYKATNLVFEWMSTPNPYQSDLPSALVTMTGDWRTFLSHKHQGRHLSPPAALRSRLLQFSLIFTHRLQHDETWTNEESLCELRELNKSRGDFWQHQANRPPALQQLFDAAKDFPLSDGELFQNRNELASALSMPCDQRRWVTDVAGTPSLHCLLPLFIELTAARVELGDGWVPSSDWFDLAGSFMLQAVIEEYLCNGAFGANTFNTVFAFGYPGSRWAEEGPDVTAMRRLFSEEDDPRREIRDWAAVKERYISELLPRNRSESSLQAIQAAQARHPYSEFQKRAISFLSYLHQGLVKPDLAQVEDGRFNIDGNDLSEADSREMVRRMGL